jgi:hypothetical protein
LGVTTIKKVFLKLQYDLRNTSSFAKISAQGYDEKFSKEEQVFLERQGE